MATGMTDPASRVHAAALPVLLSMVKSTPAVNHHDLEELESSVVEKVLRRLNSGAEIKDLDVYAKQVARNAFYDHVRRRGGHLVLEPKRDPNQSSGSNAWLDQFAHLVMGRSPSEVVIAAEDAERYRTMIIWALEQLTVSERTLLVLRHEEGRTGEEIAERLGYRNAASVDTMAARARRKLAGHLSPSLLERAGGH